MGSIQKRDAWNKGKLVGQKPPLKQRDIWAIRIHLQNAHATRDLPMFDLAIDSKLRGCDLVSLRVGDVTHGNQILSRTMVVQRKTQRPVQFELTEPTRSAVAAWIEKARLRNDQYLFPSRIEKSPHVSTRQYARIVHRWAEAAGLDSSAYGTTRCGAPRRLSSTKRQRTCGRFSCCWATSSWNPRFGTSALRWTTHWRSPNKPKFSQQRGGRTHFAVRPPYGVMPRACLAPESPSAG